MALSEFDLIERFFSRQHQKNRSVSLGIGDDAAVLSPEPGKELVVSTDTLVEGVHFLQNSDPASLGYKVLAVNLSDMAAMGAEPCSVFLALTMPVADQPWLQQFSDGFLSLAERFSVVLAGGDTTQGPLVITVTIIGQISAGKAMLRSGAKAGDRVFVTGTVGDGGLGLIEAKSETGESTESLEKYLRPEPRVQAGQKLARIASACIDVSDGLAADLGHILERSEVGAKLELESLPLSTSVKRYVDLHGCQEFPLISGDDYELCFTVPEDCLDQLQAIKAELGCDITEIGKIVATPGLVVTRAGKEIILNKPGFEHF